MRFLLYALFLICVVVTCDKVFRPIVPAYESAKVSEEACLNLENAMVSMMQSAITVRAAIATFNDSKLGISFPATLDDAKDGPSTSVNKFFTHVIEGGMDVGNWTKKGNEYFFTCENKMKTFVYNPKVGTFTVPSRGF